MQVPVLNALKQGGFSISFRGRHAHNIAIDEVHEMAINKDYKEAITKPSADYIKRVATFLPVCFKSFKKLDAQLFPGSMSQHRCATHDAIKQAVNIQAQTTKLAYKSHLTAQFQPSPIIHIFSRTGVSPDVAEDLLTFRSIAQKEFEDL